MADCVNVEIFWIEFLRVIIVFISLFSFVFVFTAGRGRFRVWLICLMARASGTTLSPGPRGSSHRESNVRHACLECLRWHRPDGSNCHQFCRHQHDASVGLGGFVPRLGSGLDKSDKLRKCVHGDGYVNECSQLAMAGSVTLSGALAYSCSNYIVKATNMMDYNKCCVREHLLFCVVCVSTCQVRVTFDMPRT
jgi:hypothetical protein